MIKLNANRFEWEQQVDAFMLHKVDKHWLYSIYIQTNDMCVHILCNLLSINKRSVT